MAKRSIIRMRGGSDGKVPIFVEKVMSFGTMRHSAECMLIVFHRSIGTIGLCPLASEFSAYRWAKQKPPI